MSSRLVIVAGQSNAYAGGSHVDDINYALIEAAFPGVRFLYRLGSTFNDPDWIEGDVDLAPQSGDGSFGVELTLGRALSDFYGAGQVVIGKFACNGTGLADHWAKTAAPLSGESQNLYTLLVAKIAAWETATGAKFTDLVWIQGNKDSDDQADAEAYSATLQKFISDLRADTGRPFRLVYDQLPTFVTSDYTATIRSQQADAEGKIGNCRMVLTEGLGNRDGDHYTSLAYLQLGRRFFGALLEGTVTAFSNFGETAAYNLCFRGTTYTPTGVWYAQLHHGPAGEDGAANVLGGPSRAAVTFGAPSGRQVVSADDLEFPFPRGAASDITIWDASIGGNCLAQGSLAGAVVALDKITIPAGSLIVPFTQLASSPLSDVSTYLSHKVLDLFFRGTAFSAPTGHKIHAYSENPEIDGSGDEMVGTNYAAKAVSWAAPTDGLGGSSGAIELGPNTHASNSWPACTHLGCKDGSGNLLTFGALSPFTLAPGQSQYFAAGQLSQAVA